VILEGNDVKKRLKPWT